MYLSFVAGNILHKFINEPYNIVYNPQNNLFDHLLSLTDNHNYYVFSDNIRHFGLSNMISLSSNQISLYNYNIHCTNGIIGYTSQNFKNLHLNSIIFTHSTKPAHIKKEDLALMGQRLERESKIFFTQQAAVSWRLNNSVIIKYGVPEVFHITTKTESRKDILILNYENSPQMLQIQQFLLKANYTCDIVTKISTSTEDININFNQYKVCIDLAEYNIVNLLCAIASGCTTISMNYNAIAEAYSGLDGLVLINKVEDLASIIPDLLKIDDEKRKMNSEQVLESFDFATFKDKINSIMQTSNKEAFIYA